MIFVSNYNYSLKKDVYKLFFFPNTNLLNSNRKLSEDARCCLSGLHRYYCVSRENRTYLHVIWSNFLYYRQNYRQGLLNCTFVVKLKHVQQNGAIIDDDNNIMKGITSNNPEKKNLVILNWRLKILSLENYFQNPWNEVVLWSEKY